MRETHYEALETLPIDSADAHAWRCPGRPRAGLAPPAPPASDRAEQEPRSSNNHALNNHPFFITIE